MAGAKKLCSSPMCLNEAVQVDPVHKCADCLKKEKKKDGNDDRENAREGT